MTKIRFHYDGSRAEITCEGHSGYADSGADIVCAAISILVHSFAELCMELQNEKKVEIEQMDLQDGYSYILVDDPKEYMAYAVKMLEMGFSSIADYYPDNLSVEWGES